MALNEREGPSVRGLRQAQFRSAPAPSERRIAMTSSPGDFDARLEQVLAEYLRAAEAGTPLDPQQLIDKYPDLAAELRSFFANRAAWERIARPLKASAVEPTVGLAAGELLADASRVRYFGDYELLDEL